MTMRGLEASSSCSSVRGFVARFIYPGKMPAPMFQLHSMFYNPKRRNNMSGGVSSVEFEKRQSQWLGSV